MKHVGAFLILFCIVTFVTAQENTSGPGPKTGRLYGRVVDNKTNKSVEAASVRLFIISKDNAGQDKDSLAGGMLSRANGDFSVENLPVNRRFRLIITAIGFKEMNQPVGFATKTGSKEAS